MPSYAILAFTSRTQPTEVVDLVKVNITTALIRSEKATVIERDDIELILKEQGLQSSGACDSSNCAVTIGRLLSADQVIIGTIDIISNQLVISARKIDIASGSIISSSLAKTDGGINRLTEWGIPLIVSDILSSKSNEHQDVRFPSTINSSQASSSTDKNTSPYTKNLIIAAGGVIVATGVIAAVLLFSNDNQSASTSIHDDSNQSPQDESWTTTVRWK